MLAAVRRPVLAVHAGAGSPAKRWATAGFRDVADRWRARGGDVIEIVGPADLALPPVSDRRAIEWGLEELGGLLGRVDGYVGNDSGVTHLAAAAGARGVAVFGPTSAHRWAPATDAIGALQAVDSSHGGIAVTSLDPSLVWRALDARCCLDKLRGGT